MKELQKALSRENSLLVADFDGTLTSSGSSMHMAARILGPESQFSCARDVLYQKYGRKVLEGFRKEHMESQKKRELDMLAELWWKKQMEVYIKEEIPERLLLEAAEKLPAREEGLEILKFCENRGIPVWIVSAGIGNVIRFWLEKHGLDQGKIHVLANEIKYEKEKPADYSPVITICNKGERFFEAAGDQTDKYLVMLGNSPEDTGWRKENTKGFLLSQNGILC